MLKNKSNIKYRLENVVGGKLQANLPKCVVTSPIMSIDEEFLFGSTWPKLIRKLQKDFGVHYQIQFLYGFRFPPLFHYFIHFGHAESDKS